MHRRKLAGEHALKVEEVFCSKTRMKILKILIGVGQLPVTRIARKLHRNYATVKSHLEILEQEGVLQHRKYGRTRLYRFTMIPRAKAVQKLIETWQNQST